MYKLIVYFAICAFLGWVIQAIYDLNAKKKIVNSGFLYGPFVPIYGVVALIIYFFNTYLGSLPLSIKLLAFFLIPTIIEYITGVMLERFFGAKLWDYSGVKWNIHGRVGLPISIGWFILVLLQVFVIQDLIFKIFNLIPDWMINIIAVLFLVYFAIDVIISFRVFYYFARIKDRIEKSNFSLRKIKIDKRILKKMRLISGKLRISPTLRANLRKEFGDFIEKIGKK